MAEMSKISGHSWLDLGHAGEESCWPSSILGGAPQEGGPSLWDLRRAAASRIARALDPDRHNKPGSSRERSTPQAAVHCPADGDYVEVPNTALDSGVQKRNVGWVRHPDGRMKELGVQDITPA
jgi:hypothetical protein